MSSNYNVILMGSMGVGKSTVINKLVGSEVAASASGGSSCTQEPTLYASQVHQGLNVIDTPGLGDPTISTRKWAERAANIAGEPIDAVVYVINSTTRVGMETQMYTLATRHFFNNCTPSRLLFIFTRAQEGGMLNNQGEDKAQ